MVSFFFTPMLSHLNELNMSNKVSPKNPKNENFEVYKGKVHDLLSKSATNLFKDKFFHEEFKSVFLFSTGIKIVSSIISFCTCVLAIHIATNLLFGYYPSILFSIIISACIEGVKTFLWRINSKWILKYKDVSKVILLALISLHFASLGFSCYGGWMLPTLADKIELKPPVLVDKKEDLNKLNISLGEITEEINKTTGEIEKTTSNSTKKALSSNLALLLSQRASKQAEILSLNEFLRLENEAIKATQKQKNEAAKKEHEKSLLTAQISCFVASIFFEILFVICSCFNVYYLFRFEIDKEAEQDPTKTNFKASNSDNLPSTQRPQKAPEIVEAKTASKPNKIGFYNRCVDSEKIPIVSCALEGCDNTFEKKVHNKKFCSDSCRKMKYQVEVYKSQKSTGAYYICSVAHTKKENNFLYFLETEILDFEGMYQVTENPREAKTFKKDKTTNYWLYLDCGIVDSLTENDCIVNNEANLNKLGLTWKGYNLVKNSKPKKS